MIKYAFLAAFWLCHWITLTAQFTCVRCFDQNETMAPGSSNRIQNGGFENSTCTPGWFNSVYNPNSDHYNCDIDHWTASGGGPNSYPSIFDSTLTVIPEGNLACYFGNGNAFACSGTWGDSACLHLQDCVISGVPPAYPTSLPGYGDQTGVILAQTVTGLTPGQSYILEFWAGGEPLSGLLSGHGLFAVDVGFGKLFLLDKPTGLPGFPIGTRYLVEFKATAPSHTVTFTNWGHICDICTELVIDDVKLYPASELPGSVSSCTSATQDEGSYDLVQIFPNPFSAEINIVAAETGNLLFTLFDETGNRIVNESLVHSLTLNTSALPAGIYYYELKNKQRIESKGYLVKVQ